VGEGDEDRLLMAYTVDDPVEGPYIEVATTPLDSIDWDTYSVPVFPSPDWEGYIKPVIWTDAVDFNYWYAYLTCTGVYEEAADNYNICTWRSKDYGETWIDEQVPLGDFDTDAWIDPDATFGTADQFGFIVCFNDTQDWVYEISTWDFGLNWDESHDLVRAMPSVPYHPVDPEIEASIDDFNVMICCTTTFNSFDRIGQTYSTDGGDNWTSLYILDGTSYYAKDCYAPALTANPAGGSWHLAFHHNQEVFYSQRPQDLSDYWQSTPDRVDDEGAASSAYPRKGIAADWITDVACICWADYRDGSPDYDTFADFAGNEFAVYVPSEYATIQEGIDAAQDGWTVWVAPGTYEEKIDFLGKAITVAATGPAHKTVIDGMQTDRCVDFLNGEGNDSVLAGFTLTNGYAAGGGALYFSYASPTLYNNLIVDNSAIYGGAMYVYNSSPMLCFNTIVGNSASQQGGALLLKTSGVTLVENSIVWGNTASLGDQIYEDGGSAKVRYSDVEGGWSGTGNIDADPDFCDDMPGDYHLHYTSPCRDAGGPTSVKIMTDFEGDPRKHQSSTDMGADEFHKHVYIMGDFVPGGAVAVMHVDVPGTSQVALIAGGNIFDPPLPCDYGLWYMDHPMIIFCGLPGIGSDGIMTCTNHIPASPLGPYTVYLQGCLDYWLTNLCTVNVE
jgi:hypothetical protein